MVNLYIFTPTNKLRSLSALLHRASKRIPTRKNTGSTSSRSQPTGRLDRIAAKIHDIDTEQSRPKFNLKVFDLVDTNLRHIPQGGLFRDVEYYKDEQEAGLCVFLVENTLFKVSLPLLLHYVELTCDYPQGPQVLPTSRTMRVCRYVLPTFCERKRRNSPRWPCTCYSSFRYSGAIS